MRYFVVEQMKPNYSAIARQYGIDPRTVKAAYLRAQSGEPTIRKQLIHHSKLDGYRDIIDDKYTAGVLPDRFMFLSLKKGY